MFCAPPWVDGVNTEDQISFSPVFKNDEQETVNCNRQGESWWFVMYRIKKHITAGSVVCFVLLIVSSLFAKLGFSFFNDFRGGTTPLVSDLPYMFQTIYYLSWVGVGIAVFVASLLGWKFSSALANIYTRKGTVPASSPVDHQ